MYTTNQVATGFRVTRQTVLTWEAAGKLKSASIANLRQDRLFDPAVVEQFAREHKLVFALPEPEPQDN